MQFNELSEQAQLQAIESYIKDAEILGLDIGRDINNKHDRECIERCLADCEFNELGNLI